MPQRYSVFLRYSRRDQEWIEVLHRNLKACLREAGGEARPDKFFSAPNSFLSPPFLVLSASQKRLRGGRIRLPEG